MERVFPKVTKCIYKRFGPTASIETNDALCTVPLNILNEKIFVILWFVYWALRILMAVGVTHRILMLFRPFRWVYYSLDLNVKFSTIRHLDRRKIFVLTIILIGFNQCTKDKIHPNGCYLVDTHSQKLLEGPECEVLTLNLQMAPPYLPILGKVG